MEDQTCKLLGYPPDARLLIVNADDFGMCRSVNASVECLLTARAITSTTVMAPCAWAPQALRTLQDQPGRAFGIHLTALGDGAEYRWRPLCGRQAVPSLVDENGYFYTSERSGEFWEHLNPAELQTEFRAQIEAVLAWGLTPTHLDWHALRIEGRPALFNVMFGLAQEYGLALRVRGQAFRAQVRQLRLPANDHDFLDSYFLGSEAKIEKYIQQLRELPAGLNEWAVHPGLADAELLAIEGSGAAVRQADLDALLSPGLRAVIAEEGIILLDYKALQTVWRNTL